MKKRTRVYTVAALLAVVLVLLLVWYGLSSRDDTPAVVLPTPTAAAPSGALPPGGAPSAETTEPPGVDISPDTVQYAIASLSRAESYSRSIIVEVFWDGGSSMSTLDIAARGGKYLISETADGLTKHSLLADGALTVWYDDSDDVFTSEASDTDALADSYQRIFTYEDVLNVPPAAILEAGYEEHDGENCISAVYTAGELGYEYRIYVSVSSGLLAAAEVHDDGHIVYSMTSVSTDLTSPGEALFTPPGHGVEAVQPVT